MRKGILIIVMLITSLGAWAEKNNLDSIQKIIDSKHFTIDVDRVYPTRGIDVSRFNPRGTLKFVGDTIIGNLPYFGRAYRVDPTSNGGIKFEGIPTEREISVMQKKKNTYLINEFTINNRGDQLKFHITIHPNGNCNIHLTSTSREAISYSGVIKAKKE